MKTYRHDRRPPALRRWRTVFVSAMVASTTIATAQWTVINLHPSGAPSSRVNGVGDGQQVGAAGPAGMWTGTPGSFTSLLPSGAGWATLFAASGGRQVGNAGIGGRQHAGLWSGTAASFIDLNPAGAFSSSARGIGDGQQAGEVSFGSGSRAALWTGSAASYVDLHPLGLSNSGANGAGGGQQVGWAEVRGWLHASLWFGTSDSWTDLHPAGWHYSEAMGVHGGQQAGYVMWNAERRASLWRGSSATWVDLHPWGADPRSWAMGVKEGAQAGFASFGGYDHAGVWFGAASSWFDLHNELPVSFAISQASGVTVDNDGTLRVVGFGLNTDTWRVEALMWMLPLCAIDIKPGSSINPINVSAPWGLIPAAILSTDDFDATTVDPGTVRLGGAPLYQNSVQPHGTLMYSYEDVNEDGRLDFVGHFWTVLTGIQAGDTQAWLTGRTISNDFFAGRDAVKVIG